MQFNSQVPAANQSQWLEPEENVLNDIDSMLCDLNKQLDDMLECEK